MAGTAPRRRRAPQSRRAAGRRDDGRKGLRSLSRTAARGGGVGGSSGVDGRIRLLCIVFVAFLALVGARAVALAASSDNLTKIALQQQTADVVLPAHRGSILDRSGNELAVGKPAQTVFATPYLLHSPADAAKELCNALQIRKKAARRALTHALSQRKSGFAYVARKVDPKLAKAALALNLPGVGSYAEEERTYPMRGSATQVLGLAGVDNTGLAGIELAYNKALSGKAGSEVVIRDPAGQNLKVVRQTQPRSGADVRLTLDEEIQYKAEDVLRRTLHSSHAKQATAIVMDPSTGEVLAMANLPMESNTQYGKKPAWDRNRAVTDVYEPG
jgi:cell division protein FtsI (penicillin-binding protein 3)